jgi:hypothetical protein
MMLEGNEMPRKKKEQKTIDLKPNQVVVLEEEKPEPIPPSPPKPKAVPKAIIPYPEFKEKFKRSMSDILAHASSALMNIRDGCSNPADVAKKALADMREIFDHDRQERGNGGS